MLTVVLPYIRSNVVPWQAVTGDKQWQLDRLNLWHTLVFWGV